MLGQQAPNIAHSKGLPPQRPDYRTPGFPVISGSLWRTLLGSKIITQRALCPPCLPGLCISCHLIVDAVRGEQSSVVGWAKHWGEFTKTLEACKGNPNLKTVSLENIAEMEGRKIIKRSGFHSTMFLNKLLADNHFVRI